MSSILESREVIEKIGGVFAVQGGRRRLERARDVAEESEAAGDGGTSEGVGKPEEDDVEKKEGDGGRFEGEGGLFGVHLDDAGEEVDTGAEGIMPDDIVGGGLPGRCFKGG